MSIKPDRWIRQMAAEHGLIEPFEPGQVREVDGKEVEVAANGFGRLRGAATMTQLMVSPSTEGM